MWLVSEVAVVPEKYVEMAGTPTSKVQAKEVQSNLDSAPGGHSKPRACKKL